MLNPLTTHYRVALGFSALSSLLLGGCNFPGKSGETDLPKYKLYPAPSLSVYMNGNAGTDALKGWAEKDSYLPHRIWIWEDNYTKAVNSLKSWVPDTHSIQALFPEVAAEYGIAPNSGNDLPGQSDAFFFGDSSQRDTHRPYFPDTADGSDSSRIKYLQGRVGLMIKLADLENDNILVRDSKDYIVPPSFDLNARFPTMLSHEMPVSVAVTPIWDTSGKAANTADPAPKQQQLVLDKLGISVQAAPPAPPSGAVDSTDAPPTSDFTENQKVTINISTALNSASVLDRIQYVTTYIYMYPWQRTTNGDLVMEKEFWRHFFSFTHLPDAQAGDASTVIRDGFSRALDTMKVRFVDSSTQEKPASIDLGTLAQQRADDQSLQLGLQTIAGLLGRNATLNATATSALKNDSTNSLTQKQELDQRSTYIDELGDFFRITQRGMKTANVAGRYQEIVTLHVPAGSERVVALVASRKPKSAPPDASATVQYELMDFKQPLYSQLDAIAFSVVVAREKTGLAPSSKEKFGLDDADDAAFVVGVTNPQRVTLWSWDREFENLDTNALFGDAKLLARPLYIRPIADAGNDSPKNTAVAHQASADKTTETEVAQTPEPLSTPVPLLLSGFSYDQREVLLDKIRAGLPEARKAPIKVLHVGGVEYSTFKLLDNPNSTLYEPIKITGLGDKPPSFQVGTLEEVEFSDGTKAQILAAP